MLKYQKEFKNKYRGLKVVYRNGGVNNPEKKYNVFEGATFLKLLDTLTDAKQFAAEFLILKAGFEEIKDFYLNHDNRLPRYTSTDIFERQLGYRLEGLLKNSNKMKLLFNYDEFDFFGLKKLREIIDNI